MPRPRNPNNEARRAATERWRKARQQYGAPEVDAVDTALSAAIAVYMAITVRSGVEKEIRKAAWLERAAANYLVSAGYDKHEAARLVGRRVHRLDVNRLLPLVDGSAPATTP